MNSPQKPCASTPGSFASKPSERDPNTYQFGFGNRFATEAIPGTLPRGQNNPQKCKYGLYAEQLNGSPFVTPRKDNQHAWLYRIRPSVVHRGIKPLAQNPDVGDKSLVHINVNNEYTQLESNFFPSNPRVYIRAEQLHWIPFEIPSERTDFVEGLKTICGCGEPTLREGLATHVYLANSSMANKAFVNADGDMLLVPNQGRLDIQTEFGKMMVSPGEICVIQAGIRWKVSLPDGASRGYIQEVFGTRFELPELGPLGANGLANPRDFEHPVANFDLDQTPWEVIYKVGGTLHLSKQDHTPFDVVAWHGNYVPYKYNLQNFINIGSLSKDHLDPSVWTVLTAKSKKQGTSLVDFAIFSERWDVAEDTFRPPYYHRNMATEFIGMISGETRSDSLRPGGVRFYTGFSPHGLDAEAFYKASEVELKAEKIQRGALVFMFESTIIQSLTDWAMKRAGGVHEHDPKLWAGLRPSFTDNLDNVNSDLQSLGHEEVKH